MPKLYAEIWAILLVVNQIIHHTYIFVSNTVLISYLACSSVFLVLLLSKLNDSGRDSYRGGKTWDISPKAFPPQKIHSV